jgi:hypothetical protein
MEVTEARATRFRDPYHAELPGNQWDTTAFQCQSPPAILTEVRVMTFKQFILLGAATLALAPAVWHGHFRAESPNAQSDHKRGARSAARETLSC